MSKARLRVSGRAYGGRGMQRHRKRGRWPRGACLPAHALNPEHLRSLAAQAQARGQEREARALAKAAKKIGG